MLCSAWGDPNVKTVTQSITHDGIPSSSFQPSAWRWIPSPETRSLYRYPWLTWRWFIEFNQNWIITSSQHAELVPTFRYLQCKTVKSLVWSEDMKDSGFKNTSLHRYWSNKQNMRVYLRLSCKLNRNIHRWESQQPNILFSTKEIEWMYQNVPFKSMPKNPPFLLSCWTTTAV